MALFDGGAGAGADTLQGAAHSIETGAGSAPAWQAGRPAEIPQELWQQDPADPTKGRLNQEALLKAYTDTKSSHGTLARKEAELRQELARLTGAPTGDGSTIPALDDYTEGFDWAALHTAAPKAYRGDDEGERKAVGALFAAARDAGMPVDRARKLALDYYTGLDGLLPEPRTQEQRAADIVAGLGPNGRSQISDVHAGLERMHAQHPFGEDEQAAIRSAIQTAGGYKALYRLVRAMGSEAPPNVAGVPDAMTEDEISTAMTSERYQRDPAYRERIVAAAQHLLRRQGGERLAHMGTSRVVAL